MAEHCSPSQGVVTQDLDNSHPMVDKVGMPGSRWDQLAGPNILAVLLPRQLPMLQGSNLICCHLQHKPPALLGTGTSSQPHRPSQTSSFASQRVPWHELPASRQQPQYPGKAGVLW